MMTVVLVLAAAGGASLVSGFATFRATPHLIARLPKAERLAFARKVGDLVAARKERM